MKRLGILFGLSLLLMASCAPALVSTLSGPLVQTGAQTALNLAALTDPVKYFSTGNTVVFDNSAQGVTTAAKRVVLFVHGKDAGPQQPFSVLIYKDPAGKAADVSCTMSTPAELTAPNGRKCLVVGGGIAVIIPVVEAGAQAGFIVTGTDLTGNATFRRLNVVHVEPLVAETK